MFWMIVKALISAVVVVAVAEISGRVPRLGALLLTLPIVSILAFIMAWNNDHEMSNITQLARETLVLVPLGLPFFVPLHSQQDGFAYGPTQGLNDPSHDGHDHSGHNHAGHTHSNLGNAYASPSDPQDRSSLPAPSLNRAPRFQPAPPQPDGFSGIRPNLHNPSPNLPPRREAPIRMDGPPPQL